MSKPWRGIFTIPCTPFTDSGELDLDSLRRELRFCVARCCVARFCVARPGVARFCVARFCVARWAVPVGRRWLGLAGASASEGPPARRAAANKERASFTGDLGAGGWFRGVQIRV